MHLCQPSSLRCRKRVLVVDTSNEIAGDSVEPHPCIGNARRMMVRARNKQHDTMLEALSNHWPEVLRGVGWGGRRWRGAGWVGGWRGEDSASCGIHTHCTCICVALTGHCHR